MFKWSYQLSFFLKYQTVFLWKLGLGKFMGEILNRCPKLQKIHKNLPKDSWQADFINFCCPTFKKHDFHNSLTLMCQCLRKRSLSRLSLEALSDFLFIKTFLEVKKYLIPISALLWPLDNFEIKDKTFYANFLWKNVNYIKYVFDI